MKNALNNQAGMLGDMFLWLVANLKQGVFYFIKQACGNEIMPSVYRHVAIPLYSIGYEPMKNGLARTSSISLLVCDRYEKLRAHICSFHGLTSAYSPGCYSQPFQSIFQPRGAPTILK